MRRHRLQTGYNVHGPHSKTFINAADRLADTGPYLASESIVGGSVNPIFALQKDTLTEYVLANHSPISWVATGTVPSTNGFRLTPITGTPVPNVDVESATIIYCTPYLSTWMALYNGVTWDTLTSAEVSYTLSGRTADLPFDIFAYNNSGNLTLEVLDWTNETTRATDLVRQDGVWCKLGTLTRRYLGTCRPRSATTYSWVTIADGVSTPVKLDLWNASNRVKIGFSLYDSTNSHNYTTQTVRQWRATATYQIDVVVGLVEEYLEALTTFYTYNDTSPLGAYRASALGYDTTSAMTTGSQIMGGVFSGVWYGSGLSKLVHQPAIGRHYYSWNQVSDASGTTTWYGDNNTPAWNQSGVVGTWMA